MELVGGDDGGGIDVCMAGSGEHSVGLHFGDVLFFLLRASGFWPYLRCCSLCFSEVRSIYQYAYILHVN